MPAPVASLRTRKPTPNRDPASIFDAIERANITEWRTLRTRATHYSLAKQAAATLVALSKSESLNAIRPEHLRAAVNIWISEGYAPATINRRLVALAGIGLPTTGMWQRIPKDLKWWLTPEAHAKLKAELPAGCLMLDYIEWVIETGLRIEETLRTRKKHIIGWAGGDGSMSIIVQGLKTSAAMATLPLTVTASALIRRRVEATADSETLLFDITYEKLKADWERCRVILGEEQTPTATLKSIRRNAARNLHSAKGMPLDLVRHYLRHEDVKTTMGYLRLTGGYDTEELKRWL